MFILETVVYAALELYYVTLKIVMLDVCNTTSINKNKVDKLMETTVAEKAQLTTI